MAMVIRDIRLDNEKFSQLFAILLIPILRGKIKMVARFKMVCNLPYRVVPAGLILTVVGKQIHDELIDL